MPVLFLLCFVLRYDVTFVDADITDTWGNTIKDGAVSWVDLPVGNKSYRTENYYSDGGLGQLFAFARSFINTVQPNNFPFGMLTPTVNLCSKK